MDILNSTKSFSASYFSVYYWAVYSNSFSPFLTQAIVDTGIANKNTGFIYLIMLAQLVLTISRMMVNFIRNWILLHISTRINISLISENDALLFSESATSLIAENDAYLFSGNIPGLFHVFSFFLLQFGK